MKKEIDAAAEDQLRRRKKEFGWIDYPGGPTLSP